MENKELKERFFDEKKNRIYKTRRLLYSNTLLDLNYELYKKQAEKIVYNEIIYK